METCVHCKLSSKFRLCTTCLKDNSVTIQKSKALKKYLDECDFNELVETKRRYYIKEITENIKVTSEKKKKEEIRRRKEMDQFFISKDSGFYTYLDRDFKNKINQYYISKYGVELFDLLEVEYKKFQEIDSKKKIRRYEIMNLFNENQIVKLGIYSDTIENKVETYVNNTHLDLHGYFRAIKEEHDRFKELQEKLKTVKVPMRYDSYLCKTYVTEGIGKLLGSTKDMGMINNLQDLVDIMEGMNFLYTRTKYQKIHNYLYRHRYERYESEEDEYYDSDREYDNNFVTDAREEAVTQWLSRPGNSIDKLPARLKLLYADG